MDWELEWQSRPLLPGLETVTVMVSNAANTNPMRVIRIPTPDFESRMIPHAVVQRIFQSGGDIGLGNAHFQADEIPGRCRWILPVETGEHGACLVLLDVFEPALELVYLGLTPESRGRGIADLMMRQALSLPTSSGTRQEM